MTHTRTRFRGEKGIAVIVTALCLIPLMTFAAFGIDLASWYSRTSFLQKSADAAALAGTVWMPNLAKSETVACESLAKNGIDGGDCGSGDFEVDIRQGATSSSLRVTVTDPRATRYFSQVLGGGDQRLTRSAEAEYNLPLPLGSPLNYFGGDRSGISQPNENYQRVDWPLDFTSRIPANGPCNVGTTAENGGWSGGTWSDTTGWSGATWSAGSFNGSNPRCEWTVVRLPNTPRPANYNLAAGAPTNIPCNANATGNGRWNSGTSDTTAPTFTNTRHTSGLGNRLCVWSQANTARTVTPVNRAVDGCNRSGVYADGRFQSSGGVQSNALYRDNAIGTRLCRWTSEESTQTRPVPGWTNPIPADRNPGFWAMIYGPGQYAANGDAFSTRCTSAFNCGSVQNAQYRALADPNRGYWYVVSIPEGVSGNVDINVFDASYNHDAATRIMDSTEGSGTPDFETEFRVYEQTNPLDFSIRSTYGTASSGGNDPVDGGCWWKLRKEAGFQRSWNKLCTIAGVQPGDTYLVNVRTNTVGAANEAGNNGYAIEAVLGGNRYATPGPSIYAYGDMGMANQNVCASGTCDGTFYLAKVGPQFAGKTLVIEMFDAGDSTGAGVSTVYPMMPSEFAPMPSVNVPAADCEFTATPDPNSYINTSDLRIHTGERRVTTLSAPDSGDGHCGIRATVGGVRQFNGEWLRIRVAIPTDYDCDVDLNNPQQDNNTCWWGIRYRFNGNASDTTTWQARVEGNPVHLTQ